MTTSVGFFFYRNCPSEPQPRMSAAAADEIV
jgi:hypothetical protein